MTDSRYALSIDDAIIHHALITRNRINIDDAFSFSSRTNFAKNTIEKRTINIRECTTGKEVVLMRLLPIHKTLHGFEERPVDCSLTLQSHFGTDTSVWEPQRDNPNASPTFLWRARFRFMKFGAEYDKKRTTPKRSATPFIFLFVLVSFLVFFFCSIFFDLA